MTDMTKVTGSLEREEMRKVATCRAVRGFAFLWLSSTLVEGKSLCFVSVLYYSSSSSSSSVSKGNLRGYWTDSIHTFTQYPVLV